MFNLSEWRNSPPVGKKKMPAKQENRDSETWSWIVKYDNRGVYALRDGHEWRK